MEWIESYAHALAAEAGTEMSVSAAEIEAVLDLARVVAHGTERRNAPLATYLAGRYAGARAAGDGVSPGEALSQATAAAANLISDPPP